MTDKIEEVAKKAGICVDQASRIILENHTLVNFWKDSELETVSLDLDKESIKRLRAIAKALKVSVDAVVCSLIKDGIGRDLEELGFDGSLPDKVDTWSKEYNAGAPVPLLKKKPTSKKGVWKAYATPEELWKALDLDWAEQNGTPPLCEKKKKKPVNKKKKK